MSTVAELRPDMGICSAGTPDTVRDEWADLFEELSGALPLRGHLDIVTVPAFPMGRCEASDDADANVVVAHRGHEGGTFVYREEVCFGCLEDVAREAVRYPAAWIEVPTAQAADLAQVIAFPAR